MSITTVNLGKIRINWRGAFAASTAYTINDAVSYAGSSYICIVAYTSTASFTTDLAANYWQLMASGASVNTTAGDITYYGASGNARLPIGQTGQVLTVGASGYPQWGNPNAEGNVYYVSVNGSDSNTGLSLNTAFLTLKKACSSVSGPATIYVKAGTYAEILPITVPANVTIIGDGMRDTIITPAIGTQSATYVSAGSSGTTLKVSSTTNIFAGMTITGTGFVSAQKVTAVVDSLTLTISSSPDTTPSGALTFRYLSTDASPVVNNLSTMFYLNDSTMLQGLLMTGMTGFSFNGSAPKDITQATIGGVYLRLAPSASISKSPYIKDCTAQSAGGVGAIIDGSTQSGGNKSMVFWAFNLILDGGVGLWCANGAKVEAVSVFTYYCYIGYTATGGGLIRSIAGNNSYGTYGVISIGYLSTETPTTATVYGGMLTYNTATSTGTFQQGETISQAVSGATGVVTSVQTGYLYYKATNGTFDTSHLVSGGTSGASLTPTAVGGQSNYVLVLSAVSSAISAGASIQFTTGDTGAYVISAVSTATVNSTSITIVTLAQQKVIASSDGITANVRYNFSLIRLQSHDFLSIGTGGIANTNYPGLPIQSAAPANQISNTLPGRVYYVSTDELGNFYVGPYFAVNQATGSATLNASAFNLSGLTSLRLGSIGAQLGAQVNEFSTDGTLSQNSDVKVPTQHAVTTYLGAAYQSIKPATDLTYDLGDPTHRWGHIYVGPGSITIGSLTLSDASGTLQVQASGVNAGANINAINNGTSNVTVANNGNVTITAGGVLVATYSSTGVVEAQNMTITGNLTVNGTTTTVNSSTVTTADKNIILASVTSAIVSTVGIVGSIGGTGPWTATITNMTTTTGLIVGSAITATAGVGSLGSGGTYIVASIVSGTSITFTATGGTTPTAGTVTNITTNGSTDVTASTSGITVTGATNKILQWTASATNGSSNTGYWNSTDNFNLGASSLAYYINGTSVLSTSSVLVSATTASIASAATTLSLATSATGASTITIGSSSYNNTVNINGNGTGGTATLGSNVTTGTINVFTSGQLLSIGASTGTTTINNTTSHIGIVSLGVSSALRFVNTGGVNTNYVAFQAPSSAAANITWTLPNADATQSGYALVSNGSGTLSWAAAGASVTDNVLTNANTYYPILSSNQTTGSLTSVNTSSSKLYYNPSTGTLNATNFNSLSDATLKTNIVDIENATAIIRLLQGVEFDWLASGLRSSGVIAQQLELVLPHLVTTNENGVKSVNYQGIIAYLIEGFKEFDLRLQKLEG